MSPVAGKMGIEVEACDIYRHETGRHSIPDADWHGAGRNLRSPAGKGHQFCSHGGQDRTYARQEALCKDAWVSAKDLRKISQVALEDMLAANRYPTMTFTSSEIKALGGDRYVAQGMLVIRGISKPVEVNVQLRSANPTMLWVEGSARIRLSDYGLKPPSAILGAIGTEDAMALNFRLAASPVK